MMARRVTLVDYPFGYTDVFLWNRQAIKNGYRIINNQGGTSSGKTYNILICIILEMLELPEGHPNNVATIVGETLPSLKTGAIRDFLGIWASCDFFKKVIVGYNKGDNVATLKNGALIEFKAYDNAQKAKAGKRWILQITECNGVKYEIAKQLISRTIHLIFLDYNANRPFWCHKHIIPREDCVTIYSNFTDNKFCPISIKKEILRYKDKKSINDWLVYGLGKTGKPENQKAFFTEFDELEHVVMGDIEINPNIPLLLSMDFNYNPSTAILLQLDYSKGLFVIKEYQQNGGTQRLLEKHLEWLRDSEYSIDITGDNSGHSNRSNSQTTDWQIVSNFMYRPISKVTHNANARHKVSRVICNHVFTNIPVFISREGCPVLIHELGLAEETDEGKLRKDNDVFRMDAVDAYRYGINFYFSDAQSVIRLGEQIKQTEKENEANQRRLDEIEVKRTQQIIEYSKKFIK